jgi:hypothetical protein
VKGSFTPGDSARTAISTSWPIANPMSCDGVRWLPTMMVFETASLTLSLTLARRSDQNERPVGRDVLPRAMQELHHQVVLHSELHQCVGVYNWR